VCDDANSRAWRIRCAGQKTVEAVGGPPTDDTSKSSRAVTVGTHGVRRSFCCGVTYHVISVHQHRGDILATLKGDASRGSDVTPIDSEGWESKSCGLSATGAARKPLLAPARGFELPEWGTTVGVVGLRFAAAITESTASFLRTSTQPTRWDPNLRHTVKVDDDGPCVPALKREVLAPCAAVHNPQTAPAAAADRDVFGRHATVGAADADTTPTHRVLAGVDVGIGSGLRDARSPF